MSEELDAALKRAAEWLANASDEEKAAMWKAQREGWSKGPHGPTDGMGTTYTPASPPSLHREPIEADRIKSLARQVVRDWRGVRQPFVGHITVGSLALDELVISAIQAAHRLAFSTPAASDAEATISILERVAVMRKAGAKVAETWGERSTTPGELTIWHAIGKVIAADIRALPLPQDREGDHV